MYFGSYFKGLLGTGILIFLTLKTTLAAATISDANWASLGDINNEVEALAVSGNTLYVGGFFSTAGGTNASYIAQWNGSNWAPVGTGFGTGQNGQIESLVVSGTNLYACGHFTVAGGNPANGVAVWNGTSWSALGSGVGPIFMYGGFVNAMTFLGTNLYVAGTFSTAGGNPANNIAEWDGSNWAPLGSGTGGGKVASEPGLISALAVLGTNLYAAGLFTSAGGTNANAIAQWNGSSWSPLGSGMADVNGPQVLALAVMGTNLYAGGLFTSAGGIPATNIARWDGSSWSPVGGGVGNANEYVWSLAVSGTNLYAGGAFTSAGGQPAQSIAQWNGSSWSPLGSGIAGVYGGVSRPFVQTLTASDRMLYAGGMFLTAGGVAAQSLAEVTIGPPTIFAQPQNTNAMAGNSAAFAVTAAGVPLGYHWFKNGNGLSDGGNVSGSASNPLSLANLYVNDPGCYQVVVTNNFGSVTSSVATLTVSNLPFSLPTGKGNQGYTSQQYWLTVTGPAGSNVVVYASTNLQSWTPLATNPITLGSLTFTDSSFTNYPTRFYQAQLLP